MACTHGEKPTCAAVSTYHAGLSRAHTHKSCKPHFYRTRQQPGSWGASVTSPAPVSSGAHVTHQLKMFSHGCSQELGSAPVPWRILEELSHSLKCARRSQIGMRTGTGLCNTQGLLWLNSKKPICLLTCAVAQYCKSLLEYLYTVSMPAT